MPWPAFSKSLQIQYIHLNPIRAKYGNLPPYILLEAVFLAKILQRADKAKMRKKKQAGLWFPYL
jgi:hypothetical protein